MIMKSLLGLDARFQSTDKHQYLLTSFCYPQHTKQALYSLYTLAVRLRRICSNQDSYIRRTNELIDFLNNCCGLRQNLF